MTMTMLHTKILLPNIILDMVYTVDSDGWGM